MSHELDFTQGQAAIAFRGAVPWHGLGAQIAPDDDVDAIRIKAGLGYEVIKTPVLYGVPINSERPGRRGAGTGIATSKNSCVLYRDDTGDDLSVVSDKYKVVQPKEVVDFYRDLTEQFGFQLEVVGALKGGRKVWALANTKNAFQLAGNDQVKGYLLLATSYDGTMATQARFTSIRVVCNNTLTASVGEGRADVTVPHSATFDADAVKRQLQVGEAWERFRESAEAMSRRIVGKDETTRILLSTYFGLDKEAAAEVYDTEAGKRKLDKFTERMNKALHDSPGAHLAAARGTLWGVINAITYDQDHLRPARDQGNRLNASWFGEGEGIKRRAWAEAQRLLA